MSESFKDHCSCNGEIYNFSENYFIPSKLGISMYTLIEQNSVR